MTTTPITNQLEQCTNCGRYGWHTTDRCDVDYQLNDVHRRMRNILDKYPATMWTLEESSIVLAALNTIVRARQAVNR